MAVARKVARYQGVSVLAIAANRKLAPVDHVPYKKRFRPVPKRPHCAATYVAINATCDDACKFKNDGCYARTGITGKLTAQLDVEAQADTGLDIALREARAIDAVHPEGVPQDGGRDGFQGRDLRLHVSGDALDEPSARALASAAAEWRRRGGGVVWTYTHTWRTVPREAWGDIQVLASCETAQDAEHARSLGYAVAMVVRYFTDRRAYRIDGMSDKLVPCPAETSDTTCVQCRLCLGADGLRARGVAIGFAVHGRDRKRAKRRLPLLGTLFGTID